MKKLLFLSLITFSTVLLQAQEESLLPVQTTETEEETSDAYDGYKSRRAIALNLGAIGGGLEYAENLTRHINLRGRLTYFRLNEVDLSLEFSGEELNGNIGSDIFIADVLFEFLPLENAGLKLVGGVSYLFNYNASLFAQYGSELTYGDLTLTPDDIGSLELGIDWSGFAPYAGLGYGRAVPKSNWGIGIELGTHYAQSPKLDVTATGSISETATQKDQLQEDLKEYRWLPFAQVRIAYKL